MTHQAKRHQCKTIGCRSDIDSQADYCPGCYEQLFAFEDTNRPPLTPVHTAVPHNHQGCAANTGGAPATPLVQTMAQKYPAYFKDVSDLTEMDVYAVHHVFQVDDPSGCIHHSSKKLLLSGVRTGGKPKWKDIKEARDTLTRWLELNGVEA